MIGRDVPVQVRAAFLVAFVLDGPILVKQGHQVAPVVRNKDIKRDKLRLQCRTDTAQQVIAACPR